MSANSTVRLVSGGTLQVRTGVLRGVGPTGPQGAPGIQGPAPAIQVGSITTTTFGSTPTATVTQTVLKTITQTVVTASSVAYTAAAHGFAVNDYVSISGITTAQGLPSSNPVQVIAPVTTNTFTVAVTTGTAGTYTSLSGVAASAAKLNLGLPTAAPQFNLSVTTGNAGSTATGSVTFNNVTGKYDFALTIPRGDTGATGSSGAGYSSFTALSTVANPDTKPTGTTDSLTTEQSFPYPANATAPAIPYFFKTLATKLERFVVARFTSSTTRSSARTAIAASEGEVTYLADDNSLWVYDGTSDQSIAQVRVSSSAAPASGTYPQGTIWVQV